MQPTRFLPGVIGIALLLAGCDDGKPKHELPPLHPVKGKVMRGGAPVKGGSLQFKLTPETPESRDLISNSEIKSDGTFELSTLHATSLKKATGVPAGTYTVTYTPLAGDQTAGGGGSVNHTLPSPLTVKAEPNEFTVELGKK